MLSLTRKKTMSISEFLEGYKLKDKNYKRNQIWEHFETNIRSNKRLEKMFVFVTGSLMCLKKQTLVYAASSGTKNIDAVGFKLLGVFRSFAYWICIIMCIVEICKSLLQGDTKSLGKIIMKYVLAFAAIYFVPWIFDLIKESF